MLSRLFARRPDARTPPHAQRPRRTPQVQNDSEFFPSEIPPLDFQGLLFIERRLAGASPYQMRRWIEDLRAQVPEMMPMDRDYARDLLVKLEHLLEARVGSDLT